MKKIFITLILLLFPLNVFAYSNYIIPGGETIGIEVNSKGLLIVGFYKVNGKYINNDLKIGDIITKINEQEINTINELKLMIDKYIDNNKVPITILRNDKKINTYLNLGYLEGSYRTGLYIKESILGVGTLTYIDPESKIFGILGHTINETKTNKQIEVRNGYIYEAKVNNFIRSTNGKPGSKQANINKKIIYGDILNNTNYGVFGTIKKYDNKELIEVGNIDEVKEGKAYIYTSNTSNETKIYQINILKIDKESKEKNYFFEVTDKELLNMSGGIVQGMSGSPIIQNNKIIGAVTRVLVDDVTKGYGINIITMLEEGDKLLK